MFFYKKFDSKSSYYVGTGILNVYLKKEKIYLILYWLKKQFIWCVSLLLYGHVYNRSNIIFPLSWAFGVFDRSANLLYQVWLSSLLHRCPFHVLLLHYFYYSLTPCALSSVIFHVFIVFYEVDLKPWIWSHISYASSLIPRVSKNLLQIRALGAYLSVWPDGIFLLTFPHDFCTLPYNTLVCFENICLIELLCAAFSGVVTRFYWLNF